MRLIDGDALENKFGISDEDILAMDEIQHAPTVDAEVVVRCKDCRYRGIIFCPATHETMGNGLIDYTSDEAYCWRGRPKEDTDAT